MHVHTALFNHLDSLSLKIFNIATSLTKPTALRGKEGV